MGLSIRLHSSKEFAHTRASRLSFPFRRLGKLIVLLAVAVGLSHNAFDGVTASILGTVKDPTGAIIPGATVTATNIDTHVSQVVSTNRDGFYTFPALQPGKYEVSINLSGFKVFNQTGVVLNVRSEERRKEAESLSR